MAIFFKLYSSILRFIFNAFIPWEKYTDILSLFFIVLLPLSAISASQLIKAIKRS